MKQKTRTSLDSLHLSDVYTLMFFILYKTTNIPEYATVSEICYLLDASNIVRLLSYFAGKTIKIPTADEVVIVVDALLLYQYVNINGMTFADAHEKITGVTAAQRDKITDLYLKIIPIMNDYNIDRSHIIKYDR